MRLKTCGHRGGSLPSACPSFQEAMWSYGKSMDTKARKTGLNPCLEGRQPHRRLDFSPFLVSDLQNDKTFVLS